MKVSKQFLNEYVKVEDLDFASVAEKMVFAGNEYEGVSKISPATNVVIGEVVECVKHPESKKLSICKVNVGDSVKQILCGAPNVAAGKKVMAALEGAILPGGIEIKVSRLAGMESQGMLCSLGELGIESKYLTEEDKEGIHILPFDAPVGSDAILYMGYDDEVIDFELTSNRADLMSYLGMAYEVGALYDRKVVKPTTDYKEDKETIEKEYTLEVKTEDCSIYLGKVVKNIQIQESPLWLKNRLMASGIRPINNVVDISNYVMLEYGQPLHFFDADKLGKKVIVRMALEGEGITTLDSIERTLKNTDIVIANENGPVALAGVMGGLETEVENDTKTIFIESAIFDSYRVRTTSKSILRSEASNRYEKGIDPTRCEEAMNRACYLLEQYASGTILSGMVKHDKSDKTDKEIMVSLSKINSILGMDLKEEQVIDILNRLQFKVTCENDTFTVLVPTRRLDISIAEDILEEIGRIHGYEHVTGTLPYEQMKEGVRTGSRNLIRTIRKRVEALGLKEVITYSLIPLKDTTLFVDHDYEKVVLLDPMSEDKKYMRNSIIPSLLSVFDYNMARNNKDICIFEIGSTYEKIGDNYQEEKKVSGLLFGNYLINQWQGNVVKVDFYLLKGIIENLLQYLGLSNRYQFELDTLKDLHPSRSCSIKVDNEIIGYFGQVHPSVHKKEVYVFEISIDKIRNKKIRNIKFHEIPKYPSVKRDVAFVVKKEVRSLDIQKVIEKVVGRLLSSIDVFDVYEGENVGADEKSLAYSLAFQDVNKTLGEEEITTLFTKIIEEVEKKCQATLRDK